MSYLKLLRKTAPDARLKSEMDRRALLGHATIAVTLDTYSHVMPGLQEEAAMRFEEGLCEAPVEMSIERSSRRAEQTKVIPSSLSKQLPRQKPAVMS